MSWVLAFSPPRRQFYVKLSEHWTAQTAFDVMIYDAQTQGHDLRRYTIVYPALRTLRQS